MKKHYLPRVFFFYTLLKKPLTNSSHELHSRTPLSNSSHELHSRTPLTKSIHELNLLNRPYHERCQPINLLNLLNLLYIYIYIYIKVLQEIGAEGFFPPIRPFATLDLQLLVRTGHIAATVEEDIAEGNDGSAAPFGAYMANALDQIALVPKP